VRGAGRLGAIGEGCVIERPGPFLWNPERIQLGRGVRIGREVRLQANLQNGRATSWIDIGDGAVIGAGSQISASLGITIGPGTRIGDEVLIVDDMHRYEDVSTPIPQQTVRPVGPVRIGAGVYIGRGAVILGGVTVGDGAVVVDRAVVRFDVPPGAWVVGMPVGIPAGGHAGLITLPWP